MVIPGDVAEMTEFQEKTMNNSRFILELCFPNVQLVLPSKGFYEKLHNRYRIVNMTENGTPIYQNNYTDARIFQKLTFAFEMKKKTFDPWKTL